MLKIALDKVIHTAYLMFCQETKTTNPPNPKNQPMTEKELLFAISEGIVKNEVHKFVTLELIKSVGRERDCMTVRKAAWKKYVEAMKDVPLPVLL